MRLAFHRPNPPCIARGVNRDCRPGHAAGGRLGIFRAGALAQRPERADHSFGEVLNSQFDETPEAPLEPSADQEAAAALMLRAMIQATGADGELDEGEKARLLERLGDDVDAQEAAFVQAEPKRPLDLDALAADTPRSREAQVYAMSLLGIDFDTPAEAQYLHKLARKFGLHTNTINDIHAKLGVQSLYT